MATQHQDKALRRPPLDAAAQRQMDADSAVNRQQAERLKATPAPPITGETVERIAEDAEQRAKR